MGRFGAYVVLVVWGQMSSISALRHLGAPLVSSLMGWRLVSTLLLGMFLLGEHLVLVAGCGDGDRAGDDYLVFVGSNGCTSAKVESALRKLYSFFVLIWLLKVHLVPGIIDTG